MLNILAAEDNNGDVMLFREALALHEIEHELYVVRDGHAAIDYVCRMGKPGEPPCPDIVLLDLNLPKVDGTTILAEFRNHSECAQTPVIVVTSSDSQKDRAKVATFGGTRYFRKPTNFDHFMELGALVKEVLRSRTSAPDPGQHSHG